MRIMIDTNVLISAFVLSSPHMLKLIEAVSENHTIFLLSKIEFYRLLLILNGGEFQPAR